MEMLKRYRKVWEKMLLHKAYFAVKVLDARREEKKEKGDGRGEMFDENVRA